MGGGGGGQGVSSKPPNPSGSAIALKTIVTLGSVVFVPKNVYTFVLQYLGFKYELVSHMYTARTDRISHRLICL